MSSWNTSTWARELRVLWNNYDPIGVFPVDENIVEWPDDEYDSYHGLIITHLNNESSHDVLFEDVKKLVTGHIGLTWTPKLESLTNEFITNVLSWFETKKPELIK